VRHVFIPAFFAVSLVLTQSGYTAGEQLPKLDVEKSCKEAQDSTGTDPGQTYKNCLADERDARKTLGQKWSSFKPDTRRNCVEAGAVPNPSYVELLTCLEMFNQALLPGASETKRDKSNTSLGPDNK
jgi:hypothetical protein